MKMNNENIIIIGESDIWMVLQRFVAPLQQIVTDINFNECIESFIKTNQWNRDYSFETNIKNFISTIIVKNRFDGLIPFANITFYEE